MATFEQLWNNYPNKTSIKSQCTNKQAKSNEPFSDYCAIMLSDCFIKAGIDTNTLKAKKCWSHSGKKHILLAEELANALKESRPSSFAVPRKINPGSFQEELSGKTGVVFFKDYWQRGDESFQNRSGDHIDLWNKNRITSSSMFTRSLLEFFGRLSDLNSSREIWFWEIK